MGPTRQAAPLLVCTQLPYLTYKDLQCPTSGFGSRPWLPRSCWNTHRNKDKPPPPQCNSFGLSTETKSALLVRASRSFGLRHSSATPFLLLHHCTVLYGILVWHHHHHHIA